jgi:hypothetical protein
VISGSGALLPMILSEAVRRNAPAAVTTDAALTQQPIASPARPTLPRTVVVWSAFGLACAGTVGLLWAIGPARRADTLRSASDAREPAMASIAATRAVAAPRILPRDTALAHGRWKAIVIHDSGSPAGDMASIERRHLDAGLTGLGFHFVIGNGHGLDDGQVSVGYRWERQLPGAHASAGMRTTRPMRAVAGPLDADALNRCAVAICLVGNADRRPYTDAQLRELAGLVRSLQAELGIGADAVYFRKELRPGPIPAGCIDAPTFRAQLLP